MDTTITQLFFGRKLSTEDKVKQMLVFKAQNQKKIDKKSKNDELNDKILRNAAWRVEKIQYQGELDAITTKVADDMMLTFESWNRRRVELKKQKANEKQIKKEYEILKEIENDSITNILNGFIPTILSHIDCANKNNPKIAKKITVDNQLQLIKTNAEDQYAKRVAIQMKFAKIAAEKLRKIEELQFQQNILSQKLAEIPEMIEDKIDMVKSLLDMLLGKIALPLFQPDLPDFDVNAIIALLKSFLMPVIQSTMPLTAIIGKIPIIGDIVQLLPLLQSGSGSGATIPNKDEIIAKVKPKLELSTALMNKVNAIKDDVSCFCMTLPTLLIQVAFSMIDLIYSKLQMIMSLLPLGNMFPLSLVPMAMTATPKILALIKVLPGLMKDLLVGILKEKWAEIQALTVPEIKFDLESFQALIDERRAKRKAKKRLTYSDITNQVYESKLKNKGYTKNQAMTIQTNYKKIYNGTDSTQMLIDKFKDNGKEQNLPWSEMQQIGGSILDNIGTTAKGLGDTFMNTVDIATNTATVGLLGTNLSEKWGENPENKVTPTSQLEKELGIEYGVTPSKLTRKKPSIEDYAQYINKFVSESELSSGLNYEKLRQTKHVVGEFYELYKQQLTSYGDNIVIEEKMEPLLNKNGTVNKTMAFTKGITH